MKNIFAYLLGAFLVFSCSNSDDNPSTEIVPLSPTELTGSLTGNTQATLNWTDNSTNETGFKIERKTGNGNYELLTTVGSDITSYTDNDLVASTMYTYRVLAYNSVGSSSTYSNQVTITISSANGTKILFESEVNDIAHLYTMNIDGTNETQITNFTIGTNPCYTGAASWSPDGTKIIFISSKDNDGGSRIYTMNSDGTNLVRINHDVRGERWPKFSPNGTKILFESEFNDIAHLYTMNIDGTNETQITNYTKGTNPCYTGEGSWSPDGTKIIFISDKDSDNDGGSRIYTMNSDGTNLIRINHDARGEANPKFSPNGTKILFESEVNDVSHLYTMNIDGTNETKITNFPNAYTGVASWSPDGTKIIFISDKDSDNDGGSEIYIMNSDGTNVVRINHNARGEWNPTWK